MRRAPKGGRPVQSPTKQQQQAVTFFGGGLGEACAVPTEACAPALHSHNCQLHWQFSREV
jgi:hypothetical protein